MGPKMRDYLGVPPNEFNAVRLLHFHKGKLHKYEFRDHLSVKNLTKFLSDFRKRKLKPYYRSQARPIQLQEHIKTLVGNTFEEAIRKSEFSVVYFYDRENRDCQAFDEIYDKIAKDFHSRRSRLSFYKMDAVHNEHPNLHLGVLPVLFIHKKEWKEPVLYERHFQEEKIRDFLEHYLEEREFDSDL